MREREREREHAANTISISSQLVHSFKYTTFADLLIASHPACAWTSLVFSLAVYTLSSISGVTHICISVSLEFNEISATIIGEAVSSESGEHRQYNSNVYIYIYIEAYVYFDSRIFITIVNYNLEIMTEINVRNEHFVQIV